MAKYKAPSEPTMQLAEVEKLTTAKAADAVGDRHHSSRRMFVEKGKLVFHLRENCTLRKPQTIYGILQARGVPESSVNNAVMVANFIGNFVKPELVSEARMDEIITHRISRQVHRITTGKTPCKLEPEALAGILNAGEKAAIGEELDCLAEHGMTIADKEKADAEAKAEADRTAKLAAEAEKAAKEKADKDASEPASAPATSEEETPEATEDESAEDDTPEATEEEPPPVVVDGTKDEPAPEATEETENVTPIGDRGTGKSASANRGATAAVLSSIESIELQSYELDSDGLAKVRAKLAEWTETIDSTLAEGKGDEVALAS
jgi:hypothetical protein